MPKRTNKQIKSLYIHIPFCSHICAYCDFTKLIYNEKFAKQYVDVLLTEIDVYNPKDLDTIYIGGGTPTSLRDEDFEKLLKHVSPLLSEGGEFSVEANVENLTKEKLLLMKRYGVTRLSVGVESTNAKILKDINRHHTFDEAKEVVKLAKECGITNINVDLIYGLSGQTKEILLKDLDNLLSLDVDHISLYSLTVSPGTMFYNKHVKEQDEEGSREFYEIILKILRKNGYKRYEISNFARNEKYSCHNLTYWKDKEYFGVGLGASGYINGYRYTNTKNLSEYLKGNFVNEKEKIDESRHLEEYLLTNFRLEDGFSLNSFKETFGFDFYERFKDVVDSFIKSGHIVLNENNVHLSDEGLLILDTILLKLFKII